MFQIKSVDIFKNKLIFIVSQTLLNLRVEIINFVVNFITVLFYVVIFATVLSKNITNYFSFLLPGLVILNILGAVAYQALKIWSLGSTSKLMGYWLSLPYTINFLLLSFVFMAVLSAFIYSLPLLMIAVLYHIQFNLTYWIIIIFSSAMFLYLLNFILVLYFFNTNSFLIIFNVSQPVLLRISPVFYPLIYLPLFALPLSFINPITWIALSFRNQINVIQFIVIFLIFDILLFGFCSFYWKKKLIRGEIS